MCVAIEPVHRLLHRLRGEPAGHRAPGLLAHDQARIIEYVEMLHDRRQRDCERRRQLAHGQAVFFAKTSQQCAPRRVRQRRKGAIERLILILNHTVYYKRKRNVVKHEPAKEKAPPFGRAPFQFNHEIATRP